MATTQSFALINDKMLPTRRGHFHSSGQFHPILPMLASLGGQQLFIMDNT
jgi:hypothetical protein